MVDHDSKSYFMFVSDLPGMVDMHYYVTKDEFILKDYKV